MHSSKVFHIHLHFFPLLISWNNVLLSLQPTRLPMAWIPPLLSPNEAASLLYFELVPALIPHLFFIWWVGAETNLDSASSHFLIQTLLEYSLHPLSVLPLLPSPQPNANLLIPLSLNPTNNTHAAKSTGSFVWPNHVHYFNVLWINLEEGLINELYYPSTGLQDKIQVP